MDFYSAIANRATVREWSGEDVPEEVLHCILNAGLKAPSNDHMRNWEFIVLRSREEKENALQFVKQWTDKLAGAKAQIGNGACAQRMYAYAIPRQYTMLLDAPYVVIPAFYSNGKVFHAEYVNQLNPFASIWCVIENIFLASSAEGLACSMRIPVGEEGGDVSALLGVPSGYVIPCYIGIGHAAKCVEQIEQNACAVEDKLHFGRW